MVNITRFCVILFLAILLVHPVTACSWYDTPFADFKSFEEQLRYHVTTTPYNTSDYLLGSDYSRESFDCTNMVALTHDYLEEKGYNVKIVRGINGDYRDNHAWLLMGEVTEITHTPDGAEITVAEDSYWIETLTKQVITYNKIGINHYKSIRVFEDYATGCGWPLSEWEH